MASLLARDYHKYPLDEIDPNHEYIWGIERMLVNAYITADLKSRERFAAGQTGGLSVEQQIRYKNEEMDVSDWTELEEFKRKLREKHGLN